MAKAEADKEEILYAVVDTEEIIKAKMTHDVIGHYNRFDIFKLYINEEKHSPVRTLPKITKVLPEKTEVTEEVATEPPTKKLVTMQKTGA